MCNCPSYSAGFVQQSPHMGTPERLGKYGKSWKPQGQVWDLLRIVAVSGLEHTVRCVELLFNPTAFCSPLLPEQKVRTGRKENASTRSVCRRYRYHGRRHNVVGPWTSLWICIESHMLFPSVAFPNHPAAMAVLLLPEVPFHPSGFGEGQTPQNPRGTAWSWREAVFALMWSWAPWERRRTFAWVGFRRLLLLDLLSS